MLSSGDPFIIIFGVISLIVFLSFLFYEICLRAKAEAEAIAIKAKALRDNPDIIQLNAIEKWDGKLPIYMADGAVMPFVQVK